MEYELLIDNSVLECPLNWGWFILTPFIRNKFNNQKFTQIQRFSQRKTGKTPPIRPRFSVDSLKNILVKEDFDMGNLFFTEFNLLDSAYYYYSNILTNYPNSSYQARTMFALGSYYLTMNNTKRADSLFNLIYENYKNQRIINAAADKLGKPLIDFNYDPAQTLYGKAENSLMKGKFDTTLVQLYRIYKKHPSSPYAAKSLFTSGWILVNKLNKPDSAAIIYDTLVKNYSRTIYATTVEPELSTFEQEQIRLKKAREDSIKKAELKLKVSSDSLGNMKKNAVISKNSPPGHKIKNVQKNETEFDKIKENIEAKKRKGLKERKFNQVNKAPPDTLIRGNFRGEHKKTKY